MAERELNWRTSSYSGTEGNCVEVALTADAALVRNTKNRAGGTLRMALDAWADLVSEVKAGRLDPR